MENAKIINELSPKELQQRIFEEEEWLNTYKEKLRSIKDVPLAEAERKIMIKEHQQGAIKLLESMARLGELILSIPNKQSNSGAGKKSLPEGVTHKHSFNSQHIFENQPIVRMTIQRALDKGEIPSVGGVMKEIKRQTVNPLNQKVGSKDIHKEGDSKLTEMGEYSTIIFNLPKAPYREVSIKTMQNFNLSPKQDCILFIKGGYKDAKNAISLMENWNFQYQSSVIVLNDQLNKWEFWFLGIKGDPFQGQYPTCTCYVHDKSEIFKVLDRFTGRNVEWFPQEMPVRMGWESKGHEYRLNRQGLGYRQIRSADLKQLLVPLVQKGYLKKLKQNAEITNEYTQEFRDRIKTDFPNDHEQIIEKFEEALYLNFKSYEPYVRVKGGIKNGNN